MLTLEEKIKIIQELCKKHDITGYEISKNSKLSASSAHKIITGENTNPRNKTLNIILDYLESKALSGSLKKDKEIVIPHHGSAEENSVAEKTPTYGEDFNTLPIDDKLNILHQENQEIINTLTGKIQEMQEKQLSLHKQFFSLVKNHNDLKNVVNKGADNNLSQSS